MKQLIVVACALCLSFLAACGVHNKSSYFSSFESFVEKIEKKESYSDEQLDKLSEKYKTYSDTYYTKYKDKFTETDRRKVGELNGRYVKATTKHRLNNTLEPIKKATEEAGGFIEGIFK